MSALEISYVQWCYEDELPEMERSEYDALFSASRVDVVRLFPYVEDSKGNRIWITSKTMTLEPHQQRVVFEKAELDSSILGERIAAFGGNA